MHADGRGFSFIEPQITCGSLRYATNAQRASSHSRKTDALRWRHGHPTAPALFPLFRRCAKRHPPPRAGAPDRGPRPCWCPLGSYGRSVFSRSVIQEHPMPCLFLQTAESVSTIAPSAWPQHLEYPQAAVQNRMRPSTLPSWCCSILARVLGCSEYHGKPAAHIADCREQGAQDAGVVDVRGTVHREHGVASLRPVRRSAVLAQGLRGRHRLLQIVAQRVDHDVAHEVYARIGDPFAQ